MIPNDFIQSSDYATLKNDDGNSTSVTFPGSSSVANGATSTVTADLTIGSTASINRVQISSSKDSSKRFQAFTLGYTRTGTVSGSPSPYSISGFANRISATTIRCTVTVFNPSSGSLTTASGDETFTFYIDTFIPPF